RPAAPPPPPSPEPSTTSASVSSSPTNSVGRTSTAAGPRPRGRGPACVIRSAAEDLTQQLLLLRLVRGVRTDRGRAVGRTGDAPRTAAAQQLRVLRQLQRQVRPRAHVDRLVLHPQQLGVGAEARQLGVELLLRERVEPLQADQGDVLAA